MSTNNDLPGFQPIIGLTEANCKFQSKTPERISSVYEPEAGAWFFEVQSGDQVAATKDIDRAEMYLRKEVAATIPMGEPIKLQWNLYIPRNFPTFYKENGHFIMGQFHHHGKGSPKMSFQYRNEDGQDLLYLKVRESVNKGSEFLMLGPLEIERGRVDQTIKVEGVFSANEDKGKLRVTHTIGDNYSNSFDHIGANLYPLDGDKVKEERFNIKLGIYRDGRHPEPCSIAIGNFSIDRI